MAKPEKNKGAQKQEIWTECIQELAERPNFDKNTRNVLQRIATQSNVPRKKPKFVNFLKSSMRFAPSQAEKIWTIIEEGLEEFRKKAAPAATASAGDAQQSSSSPSPSNSESSTANGNEVAIEAQNTDNEIEANGDGIASNRLTVESVIEHALSQSDLAKSTKKTLKKLQKCEDIPLNVQSPKKKKFLKFVQDQLQLDAGNGNAVWDCLSRSIQMLSDAHGISNGSNSKINDRKRKLSAANGTTEVESKKAKTEVILADSTTDANGESTFDWQKHILRIFSKANTNKQIPLELLKTKVIRKFSKSVGEDESNSAQYEKKFKKILKKIDSLTITNGVVHQNWFDDLGFGFLFFQTWIFIHSINILLYYCITHIINTRC